MTAEEKLNEILDSIEKQVEQPFVTARFGDNWKQHAREHYSFDDILQIAWKNGRTVVLLENVLRELLAK
jgi:hypothetical protein